MDDFCQPVYEIWLAEAVARGRVNAPGFFADPRIRAAWCGTQWIGPAQSQIDPKKEVDAAIQAVDRGFKTHQQATVEMDGGDWDENVEQLAREKAALSAISGPAEAEKTAPRRSRRTRRTRKMSVISSLFKGGRQSPVRPVITAPAAPYCMERISDTEAEISLYGDIVQRRPTDWSTGKPSEGQYIILSEFLKDLKAIEDVSKLTVRIHSAGGNAYDAITIHNRLKELPAEITVIVDGIAMSGGSLIMCAANKVKVNPASLVMIHKCWSFVWDAMNADELRKMAESNDAVDRAQAAIYHAKTGMSEADLLALMGNETYMTGREAVDKGFADELIDGEAPDIAASADRRTIYYCGQPVWATPAGLSLPISKSLCFLPLRRQK